MSKAIRRLKGQNAGKRFVGLPYDVVSSQIWTDLSGPEVKLIVDLTHQYNGNNNGMLSACHSLMGKRGWAKASLYRAFSSLQHKGFVVVTRMGWRKKGAATLVAITWMGINEPREGLEYDPGFSPSQTPLNYWCKDKSCWRHKPQAKEQEKFLSSKLEDKNPSSSSILRLVRTG